jgi:hypothetical protein
VSGPLDTRWLAWLTLATVMVWLVVTQRLRAQVKQNAPTAGKAEAEVDCARFPDQCPCTTELGKGVA